MWHRLGPLYAPKAYTASELPSRRFHYCQETRDTHTCPSLKKRYMQTTQKKVQKHLPAQGTFSGYDLWPWELWVWRENRRPCCFRPRKSFSSMYKETHKDSIFGPAIVLSEREKPSYWLSANPRQRHWTILHVEAMGMEGFRLASPASSETRPNSG